jgi:hypothetical protein
MGHSKERVSGKHLVDINHGWLLVGHGLPTEGRPAPFASLSVRRGVGAVGAYGVGPDGSVTCWAPKGQTQTLFSQPTGPLTSISVGSFICGIRPDGTLVCWGLPAPPAGTFKKVSVGGGFACAIQTDDALVCWATDRDGDTLPPAGTFKDVSCSDGFACAVRESGLVTCWGSGSKGQASPPPGSFLSIATGDLATCGVLADQSVIGLDDVQSGR